MKWTKLKVHVNPIAIEAVSDMVLGLGIEGIEIEDNFLSVADQEAMYVNYVDESLVPYDEYRVVAYLDETMDVAFYQEAISKGLQRISAFLPIGSGKFSIEEMPDEDYENKWKEHYQPFRVGSKMVITPIWETPHVEEDDVVIRIDPGLAFGSGTHETTALCIEFLQQLDLADKKIVDVGCGSGILGIAAVKLGARDVIGIDIDENAVTIARENLVSNNVQGLMTIQQGNLLDNIDTQVEVVVANILADVIMLITPEVKSALQGSGYFIASGILSTRLEEVTNVLAINGFEVIEIKEKGEWSAVLSTKT